MILNVVELELLSSAHAVIADTGRSVTAMHSATRRLEIDVGFSDDVFRLRCSFRFLPEDEPRELNVVVSAVGVEVITI